MNSKVLVLIIGAVLVVGGGYFFLNGSSGSEGGMADTSGGKLAALMASGKNLECTFRHDDGTNVSSGTVYLASGGEQIRGDFTLEQAGSNTHEGHMIRTGGYNHVWGSFFEQGIKTKITEENKNELFDDDSGSIDDDTEFECTSWRVDQSKFSLPGNVTFMDISAQMDEMTKMQNEVMGGEGIQAMQCEACNQVPEGSARQLMSTSARV